MKDFLIYVFYYMCVYVYMYMYVLSGSYLRSRV